MSRPSRQPWFKRHWQTISLTILCTAGIGMLAFVLFSPNTPKKKSDIALNDVDDQYAPYDCSGIDFKNWPNWPPRDKQQSSITKPPQRPVDKRFIEPSFKDVEKSNSETAKIAMKDPKLQEKMKQGKVIVTGGAGGFGYKLSREQVHRAEQNAFVFFQKKFPDLIQFLQSKGFHEPTHVNGVPFIQGPPEANHAQVWAWKTYRAFHRLTPRPEKPKYYQLFGEHLALAVWWVSQKSSTERSAGVAMIGCITSYVGDYLKDDPLISKIATQLILPNLQYGGGGNARTGSQIFLWSRALRVYKRTNQIDLYIKACRRVIELHPKTDFGDEARLYLASKLEDRGKVKEAIQILESIDSAGRIFAAKRQLRLLKKKFLKKQNSQN